MCINYITMTCVDAIHYTCMVPYGILGTRSFYLSIIQFAPFCPRKKWMHPEHDSWTFSMSLVVAFTSSNLGDSTSMEILHQPIIQSSDLTKSTDGNGRISLCCHPMWQTLNAYLFADHAWLPCVQLLPKQSTLFFRSVLKSNWFLL